MINGWTVGWIRVALAYHGQSLVSVYVSNTEAKGIYKHIWHLTASAHIPLTDKAETDRVH